MEASNVKAMREALEAINCIDTRGLKRLLCELVEAHIFDRGLINKTIAAVEKAKRALAEPPRNCDVGTVKEQEVRFDAFVQDRRVDLNCTGKCPAHNGVDFGVVACVLQWSQMPYNSNEGGLK